MKEFPKNIQFKYPWRSYQQRALDELDTHLEDDHLHVIAPPGSGKTILGLEVAFRLNKPTLIFAPTLAIRNQWINRFTELFLQTDQIPSWISRDIRNPKFLTVSTYQGLFAACAGSEQKEENEENEEEIDADTSEVVAEDRADQATAVIDRLKNQGIGTIIVDEAHHLKNAWWKSLNEVKQHLSPTIVGLTATPPYDVSYTEWKRYLELNGPVDTEISVPELVVEGDLCPHQDYVLVSYPTPEEHSKLVEYQQRIEQLFQSIKNDSTLKEVCSQLPIITQPEEELEWIYTHLEQYSATLIFLNAVGYSLQPVHLEVIGDKEITIPKLDLEWMEILLEFYLYSPVTFLEGHQPHKDALIHRLKRSGAIERKRISLRNFEKRRKLLSSSLSKLESIHKIAEFESNQLQRSLRMVVLTDYIRKEYLVKDTENTLLINKIGVMPIFEKLRRSASLDQPLGVLTGSIVIIPTTVLPLFEDHCANNGLSSIAASELPFDGNYTQIQNSDKVRHLVVPIITQLFEQGHIGILIGTKSLLGEGWDAPAINALILASFVGSYVSSNQMRGRAIRKLHSNENKTGNIWHLACAEIGATAGGADIELLKRRFKAFVGVSYALEPTIESGMDRLTIPDHFHSREAIELFNQRIFAIASNREGLREAWMKALVAGSVLVEEMKVPFREKNFQKAKSMNLYRTMAYLFAVLSSGLMAFGDMSLDLLMRNLRHFTRMEDLLWWLAVTGFVGLGIFGRLLFKSLRLFFKYRDISKDVRMIGIALLDTLCELRQIKTPRRQLKVEATQNKFGSVFCHLEGGTTYEKSLFIQSLTEIVDPIDNPRYLIVRKSSLFGFNKQRDYHAVPESIGRLKKMAAIFEKHWRRHVGSCELIFTRNIEGRKILLRSRLHSLATELEGRTERVNKWK